MQDCALKALSARRIPEDERAYRAWIFTILRNLFIDRLRRKQVARAPFDEEPPAESWQVWQCNDSLISTITVRLGMAKLTAAQREILALVDIAGFSYAETAAILGVPRGTVMSRLSRARQALLLVLADNNVRALPADARRRNKP